MVVVAWYSHARRVRIVAADAAPRASPLAIVDEQGRRRSLAEYRGRVVLLNLWASWCGPCRTEIPRLNRLDATRTDRGLVVLGVNVESLEPEHLAALSRDLGIDYTVASPASRLEGTFAWDGVLPYTWLIDGDGRVRAAHAGLAGERALRSACDELLDEISKRPG